MIKDIRVVQTRAFVPDVESVKREVEKFGFTHIKTQNISDAYYCDPKDIDPHLHTYEKTGKAFRIRTIVNENGIYVQILKDSKSDSEKPNHDKYLLTTLFTGTSKDTDKAKQIAIIEGFPDLLIEVNKLRKTYSKKDLEIFLDEVDTMVYIIEINSKVDDFLKYPNIKKKTKRTAYSSWGFRIKYY